MGSVLFFFCGGILRINGLFGGGGSYSSTLTGKIRRGMRYGGVGVDGMVRGGGGVLFLERLLGYATWGGE